tara:strand:- start:928 stop:1398 length:471 start_codon:yes stop_codon:yes gene_type:complete
MPEKVTRQEKIISLAIEKARKAKEELSAKKRMNIEPTQVLEIDTDPEVEKIKRPKVQDASKITNQTQKKEGYGLAGESLKKQSSSRKLNIEKFVGKTGAVEELQDMIEKEFGKVKSSSSSSYRPAFIIPIDLIVYAESTRGDSEDYTIKEIKFMKK